MEDIKRGKTKMGEAKNQKTVSSKTKQADVVPVTFTVTVPENTAGKKKQVYIAGSFQNFSPNFPDWDPHGLAMKKLSPGRWSITLMGQPQTDVSYKYTLGSWDQVEGSADGYDIPNRQVFVGNGSTAMQTIEDTVQSWRNT